MSRGNWKSGSVQARVRAFFENNPDEALSQADIAAKFDCSGSTANSVIFNLLRAGYGRERFLLKTRAPAPDGSAQFPDNLTMAEHKAVQAYAEHGTCQAAGRVLGLSQFTVADHLKNARGKAGVGESVVLVARYVRAITSKEQACQPS